MLVVVVIRRAIETEHRRAEEQRLTADNARLDAENAALRSPVDELEAQVAALSEKVAMLTKLLFGTSSEKKPAEPVASKDGEIVESERHRRPRGQQPSSVGHGRRDYSGLESVEEIHDLPEDERVCAECGSPYAPFGEETCEQVDWQVRIVRIVHRRPTRRRSCCCAARGVRVAPVPTKPILKGRFTTQFLARLLVEKYVLGRPLKRVGASKELSVRGASMRPSRPATRRGPRMWKFLAASPQYSASHSMLPSQATGCGDHGSGMNRVTLLDVADHDLRALVAIEDELFDKSIVQNGDAKLLQGAVVTVE